VENRNVFLPDDVYFITVNFDFQRNHLVLFLCGRVAGSSRRPTVYLRSFDGQLCDVQQTLVHSSDVRLRTAYSVEKLCSEFQQYFICDLSADSYRRYEEVMQFP
jgi:hypothetical protein